MKLVTTILMNIKMCLRSRGSSLNIKTSLLAGQLGFNSRLGSDGNFSLFRCVQACSGARLASCLLGTGGSNPGSKAERGVKLNTHLAIAYLGQECVELYLRSPVRLHGMVL